MDRIQPMTIAERVAIREGKDDHPYGAWAGGKASSGGHLVGGGGGGGKPDPHAHAQAAIANSKLPADQKAAALKALGPKPGDGGASTAYGQRVAIGANGNVTAAPKGKVGSTEREAQFHQALGHVQPGQTVTVGVYGHEKLGGNATFTGKVTRVSQMRSDTGAGLVRKLHIEHPTKGAVIISPANMSRLETHSGGWGKGLAKPLG